jgi:general secretion pathway protein A
MYLNYFGLSKKPFNITPDPSFLYLSDKHKEAFAHLLFCTDESSSFIVLTGEVGTGKTMLCRTLLDEGHANTRFALILNPMQSPQELLASACDEFGIEYPAQLATKSLVDALNAWLLKLNAKNEQAILIIDEAQNLDFATLEQIRLLTNLETETKKLLKIILIGQPELKTLLNKIELRQLNQRVTARYHLTALNAEQTAQYVIHRLRIAGARQLLFSAAALKALYRQSQGIPRRINVIADRALTGAYALQKPMVDASLIKRSAAEIKNLENPHAQQTLFWVATAMLLIALTAGAFLQPRFTDWLQEGPSALAYETDMLTPEVTMVPAVANNVALPSETDSLPSTISDLDEDSADIESRTATEEAPPENKLANISSNSKMPIPISGHTDEIGETESALQTLFSYWNLTLDASASINPCEQAQQAKLYCLREEGSVEKLKLINRPALINYYDASGAAQQMIITGISADKVRVIQNDSEQQLSITELRKLWPGHFLSLWQAPPSGRTTVFAQESSQSDIDWLQQRLTRLALLPDIALHEHESRNLLAEAILSFQTDQHLYADGIAGKRTLLKIEEALEPKITPTLGKP